jgi:hypothetical protein
MNEAVKENSMSALLPVLPHVAHRRHPDNRIGGFPLTRIHLAEHFANFVGQLNYVMGKSKYVLDEVPFSMYNATTRNRMK